MSLLPPVYISKARDAFKLALPIIAGQLGQILMGFFDTVQIGGLGYQYIAGSGFGNNIFWMTNLFGLGILFAISTLVSESIGEKNPRKAIGIYHSGLKVALVLTIIFSIIMLIAMRFVHVFRQDEAVNVIAIRYLRITIFSIPLVFFFANCKQLLDGMGRTKIGMYITLVGLVLNVFINWVLIYGKLGMPKLEIEGAAIATVIARAIMTVAFLIVIWFDKEIKELRARLNSSPERNKSYVGAILRIGIPSGLQFFWEIAAFGVAQIMSGWLGIVEQAAHQVAIGLASITFMVLTGISTAGNILSGYSYGAKDREGIRVAGNTVFMMTLLIEAFFALVFLVFHEMLPTLYTDNTEVIAIASSMLILAAVFQISDGLQAAAAGVLRGMQDVKVPVVVAFFAYWAVMIPLGYVLAFKFHLGLKGIWIAFIIGLSLAALSLLLRFWWIVERVKFKEV